MTDETTPAAPAPDPQLLTEEILALTVLKDAVLEELDGKRALIGEWTVGTKHTVFIPNESKPTKPIKIGEVRCDGGAKTARISDRAAWEAWVAKAQPHNMVTQPAGRTGWALDADSVAALDGALTAAAGVVNADDPWSPADPTERARVFLDALEAAGFTLDAVTVIPERSVVLPIFEEQTLKMSHDAGDPVAPGGEVPDGVEVTVAAGKPYVIVSNKDDDDRIAFLYGLGDRLPQLEGFTAAIADARRPS